MFTLVFAGLVLGTSFHPGRNTSHLGQRGSSWRSGKPATVHAAWSRRDLGGVTTGADGSGFDQSDE